MNRRLILAALATSLIALPAQAAPETDGPIADNSFLIEEAYNQEPGVVQHINAFKLPRNGAAWEYNFTQEWPMFGQASQLSYGIPVTGTGLGNLMLNYRYQALGVGGGNVAFAPRLSLVLPTSTASQDKGLGYEVNLPLSTQWGDALVAHTNLGATFAPGEKVEYFAGQSLIWLASSTANPMLEVLWKHSDTSDLVTVNPGVRWAYNLGETQVVPGVAAPVTFGGGATEVAALFYLSVEHPFGK